MSELTIFCDCPKQICWKKRCGNKWTLW